MCCEFKPNFLKTLTWKGLYSDFPQLLQRAPMEEARGTTEQQVLHILRFPGNPFVYHNFSTGSPQVLHILSFVFFGFTFPLPFALLKRCETLVWWYVMKSSYHALYGGTCYTPKIQVSVPRKIPILTVSTNNLSRFWRMINQAVAPVWKPWLSKPKTPFQKRRGVFVLQLKFPTFSGFWHQNELLMVDFSTYHLKRKYWVLRITYRRIGFCYVPCN